MGLCRNRVFSVVTEFGQDKKGFMSQQSILCLDKLWPRPRVLVLRQSNLCRDRVWPRPRNFMSQ